MKLKCVNISTTNVLEMSQFYSLVLNKPYLKRSLNRYEILIDNCCIVISFSNNKSPINPDYCRLEFIVDDIDMEYNRLISAGITISDEPKMLPWNYKYFAITDPDGNHIDFVEFIG